MVYPIAPQQQDAAPWDRTPWDNESVLSFTRLWRVIQRRRRPFLLALGVVSVLSFSKTVLQEVYEPTYDGQFTLLISDPVSSQSNRGQDGGGSIESLARNTTAVDVPTLIQVLQSGTVLEPVYNRLRKAGVTDIPSVAVQLVQVGTGANNGGNVVAGGVLQITARGRSQIAVQQMLDLTQKAYIDWSLQQKRLQLTQGVRFLDEQEPLLRSRNAELQAELQRFRQEHNVLDPEADAKGINSQMLDAESQILQLNSARQQLLAIRSEVLQGRLTARSFNLAAGGGGGASSGGGGGGSSGGSSGLSAGLPSQGALDEWQRLEQQIGSARGLYQADSPVLQSLIASQNRLRPVLLKRQLDAVQAALRQNSDSLAAARSQLARLQQNFQGQPKLLSSYQALMQRIEIAATNLTNYLKTRDQFQLEIAQKSSPWQIITPTSVRRTAASTGLGKGFIQALILGLLAGITAAIARDRLDHVYHAPQEVERELGMPLLGHMPYVKLFEGLRREHKMLLDVLDQQTDKVGRYQRFYYQEALRNLYTSLRFLDAGKMLRSIALTSTTPAEGKSLVNILLAKTLGELGMRVLLVDADLRKPQLHQRLGIDNLRGLSNLLTEPELDWSDLVQPIAELSNVSVITAGRTSPNPPRLLSSPSMGELVRSIAGSGRYDMVIYDAPPLLGLADASLLAEHLDGLLLLVSLNRVDRGLPLQAVKRLRNSGANLLGIVTNGVRPKGEGGGVYAYTYGRARRDPYAIPGYGALDPAASYAYYEASELMESAAGSEDQPKPPRDDSDGYGPDDDAPPLKRQRRSKRFSLPRWDAVRWRLTRWLDG